MVTNEEKLGLIAWRYFNLVRLDWNRQEWDITREDALLISNFIMKSLGTTIGDYITDARTEEGQAVDKKWSDIQYRIEKEKEAALAEAIKEKQKLIKEEEKEAFKAIRKLKEKKAKQYDAEEAQKKVLQEQKQMMKIAKKEAELELEKVQESGAADIVEVVID